MESCMKDDDWIMEFLWDSFKFLQVLFEVECFQASRGEHPSKKGEDETKKKSPLPPPLLFLLEKKMRGEYINEWAGRWKTFRRCEASLPPPIRSRRRYIFFSRNLQCFLTSNADCHILYRPAIDRHSMSLTTNFINHKNHRISFELWTSLALQKSDSAF